MTIEPKEQTGHTPGPWWRDEHGFVAAGNGDTYVTIADFDCSDMDIEEREANKALAIAAPELLEALQGLFRECAMVHKHWGEGSNSKEADKAIQAARAAIAKATGETK